MIRLADVRPARPDGRPGAALSADVRGEKRAYRLAHRGRRRLAGCPAPGGRRAADPGAVRPDFPPGRVALPDVLHAAPGRARGAGPERWSWCRECWPAGQDREPAVRLAGLDRVPAERQAGEFPAQAGRHDVPHVQQARLQALASPVGLPPAGLPHLPRRPLRDHRPHGVACAGHRLPLLRELPGPAEPCPFGRVEPVPGSYRPARLVQPGPAQAGERSKRVKSACATPKS